MQTISRQAGRSSAVHVTASCYSTHWRYSSTLLRSGTCARSKVHMLETARLAFTGPIKGGGAVYTWC
jgi:hypothetical protein